MNIQDIAEFIDLVKDPDKYSKFLNDIRAEQERLNAAIETVGKASELDNLRKTVEKQRVKLEQSFATRTQELETDYQNKLKTVTELQAKVEADAQKARVAVAEAEQAKVAADNIVKSFAQRDKELRKQEAIVEDLKKELAASVLEYNEKLAKLRAVMV